MEVRAPGALGPPAVGQAVVTAANPVRPNMSGLELTNARAEISQAALARTASSAANMAKVIPLDWAEMIKLRDGWNQRWRCEVIAAAGR